jgi:hypothetical protein
LDRSGFISLKSRTAGQYHALLISTAHGTGQNGGREFGFGYSTKGFHQSSPVCGLLLKYCCADEI